MSVMPPGGPYPGETVNWMDAQGISHTTTYDSNGNPVTSATNLTNSGQQSIYDIIEQQLEQWGISDLGDTVKNLLTQGLTLVERNYRVAGGPGARGAEVDLIMRERDGTLVFVEVRARSGADHGGAAASVSRGKQRRCILGARHYLMALDRLPPCRFDVVAIEGEDLNWIQAAFMADG